MGGGDNDVYSYDESHNYPYNDNSSGDAYGYSDDPECDSSIDSNPVIAATHYIPLVVFPILLMQGIVGNLLAIPVLISVSRSAWSTVIYLACLAGTDLIILLIRCGSTWYLEAARINLSEIIMSSSDAACKTYYFSFMCVQHINPWLLVAVSVETMVATRWPKRTYAMCTLERAKYVLLLMSILVICLDINHFWTFGVPKPGLSCMYTEEFSDIFKDYIWPAMDNTVGIFLPLAAVSVCFGFTAGALIRRRAKLEKNLDVEMKKYFMELDTLRDFRAICFILCLFFICLSLFKTTYVITTYLGSLGYLECATCKLVKTLDMTFTFFFYGAKIYVYLAVSSMFRVKLKHGFLRLFRRVDTFCRTVCTCGRKWTPIPPRDNCADGRTHQSQNPPFSHNEVTKTNKNIGMLSTGKTKQADKTSQVSTAGGETCDNNDPTCNGPRKLNQKAQSNRRNKRLEHETPIKETGTKV